MLAVQDLLNRSVWKKVRAGSFRRVRAENAGTLLDRIDAPLRLVLSRPVPPDAFQMPSNDSCVPKEGPKRLFPAGPLLESIGFTHPL